MAEWYFLFKAFFILKLCFVGGLILYHVECHVMFKQLQRDYVKHSSFKLRLWNEVATVFLVAIVFVIVLQDRNNSGFVWGILGLIIFSLTLVMAIKIYKKSREKYDTEKKVVETKKDNPTPLSKEQD